MIEKAKLATFSFAFFIVSNSLDLFSAYLE